MKFMQNTAVTTLIVLLFAMAGCEQEGPAEKAGENIDESIESMQESASEAGEKMGEELEKAGDELEEATDSAAE